MEKNTLNFHLQKNYRANKPVTQLTIIVSMVFSAYTNFVTYLNLSLHLTGSDISAGPVCKQAQMSGKYCVQGVIISASFVIETVELT
jgi:hypothetical protein